MSKTELLNENVRCELVGGEDISQLTGELKTIIDSLGLPEKQEKALKDVISNTLWEWFNFITDHNLDYLLEKKKWYAEYRLDFEKPKAVDQRSN
jgi:hypothetical protein